MDNGEKLGRHEEFRRLMNLPIDVYHWDAEAGEAIYWIKQLSAGDFSFVQWLVAGDDKGKFLRWLMRAGPNALDYFRDFYAGERARITRTQR